MREGWEIVSLQSLTTHVIGGAWGKAPGESDVEVIAFGTRAFVGGASILNAESGTPRSISQGQYNKRALFDGDIILEVSGGSDTQPVGRVLLVKGDTPFVIPSSFMRLVRFDLARVEPRFAFFVLQWLYQTGQSAACQSNTTGIRNLNVPAYLDTIIALPPLAEQRRIVDLIGSLDEAIAAAGETSKVAKDVADELRQNLISPREGWAPSTLGDIASFDNGYPFKPADLGVFGTPVIRIRQLLNPSVDPDRSEVRVKPSQKITDGDLIFSWSGTLAVRAWSRGDGLLNQHLFKVTPKAGATKDFVKECLELAIPNLHTHGTTMVHVTKKELLSYKVTLPSLPEQEAIAATLASARVAIETAQEAAEELREVRSNLLTALLSGEHEIPESYDNTMEVAA